MTLKAWIEEMAEGEAVIAVVIGEMGWGDYGSEDVPGYKSIPCLSALHPQIPPVVFGSWGKSLLRKWRFSR